MAGEQDGMREEREGYDLLQQCICYALDSKELLR